MVLSGIIEEIVYRNNDNNYTVAVLDVNGEPITCVGRRWNGGSERWIY